jgi:hypothetical protein
LSDENSESEPVGDDHVSDYNVGLSDSEKSDSARSVYARSKNVIDANTPKYDDEGKKKSQDRIIPIIQEKSR